MDNGEIVDEMVARMFGVLGVLAVSVRPKDWTPSVRRTAFWIRDDHFDDWHRILDAEPDVGVIRPIGTGTGEFHASSQIQLKGCRTEWCQLVVAFGRTARMSLNDTQKLSNLFYVIEAIRRI